MDKLKEALNLTTTTLESKQIGDLTLELIHFEDDDLETELWRIYLFAGEEAASLAIYITGEAPARDFFRASLRTLQTVKNFDLGGSL